MGADKQVDGSGDQGPVDADSTILSLESSPRYLLNVIYSTRQNMVSNHIQFSAAIPGCPFVGTVLPPSAGLGVAALWSLI